MNVKDLDTDIKDLDRCEQDRAVAHSVLEYSEQLLNAPTVPQIPECFAQDEKFIRYHQKLIVLRTIISSFASGDLSPVITTRGFIAGSCKALQANLRHLVWKVQQVEKGDYTQRVDFMGDFSESFNSMVVQLATTIQALKEKEEALSTLAVSLQEEARRRSATLQELKKSEAKFKYLAQHDPLTGSLNRRSFFSLAEAKLQSAFALGNSCCVCLLDVDHFKTFNDSFGHIEGDRALKHVVEQSMASLRQSDIMGRYGGEEFIFFFSGADLQQGYAAADRIRSALEESPFSLNDGQIIPLKVSLGVACLLSEWSADATGEELLQYGITQADAALYEAKAKGRNQVCLAPLRKLGSEILPGTPFSEEKSTLIA